MSAESVHTQRIAIVVREGMVSCGSGCGQHWRRAECIRPRGALTLPVFGLGAVALSRFGRACPPRWRAFRLGVFRTSLSGERISSARFFSRRGDVSPELGVEVDNHEAGNGSAVGF